MLPPSYEAFSTGLSAGRWSPSQDSSLGWKVPRWHSKPSATAPIDGGYTLAAESREGN
jgi:hypothetical protein